MAQIDTGKIAYCQIYPGVGIARIGNSPKDFFIGPETPGQVMASASGFKDKAGRVKRQAARFRLYGFDKDNVCLGELLADDKIDITWTVHLANVKASYNTFLDHRDPGKCRNRRLDQSVRDGRAGRDRACGARAAIDQMTDAPRAVERVLCASPRHRGGGQRRCILRSPHLRHGRRCRRIDRVFRREQHPAGAAAAPLRRVPRT